MVFKLEDYKVGWITALPIEAAAAKTMLDEIHPSLQIPFHDSNVYTFGQANTTDQAGAGTHNVVIASGRPGKANAATVANDMRRTFPWLRIGLMVGIAGGVWSSETDVRLGDVVVGIHPTGEAGIIQYDYGRSIQDKTFVKTGAMNKAPGILLNAVAAVQAEHLFHDLPDTKYISNLGREYAKKFAKRPAEDRLFHASYTHQTGSCEQCDRKQLRDRPQRDDSLLPRVHYGAIASGDRVVRDAVFAEETRKAYGVLCFEMEAAGLDGFPSLTIRGVSDYCDTHKNDDWHQYAAVSAAAYAKELLNVIAPTAVSHLPTIGNVHWIMPRRSNLLFTGREDVLQRLKHQLIPRSSEKQPISVFQGIGGSGKSEMAIRFAEENKQSFWGIFWIDVSSQVMAEQSFADLAQAVGLSNTTVQHVVHWLSNISRPWLLILDNCDDKEINVSKFVPSSGGSIIITTRLAGFQGTLEVLDTLNHGDAIELLRKACILDVEEQQAYTHDADAVVELLGCHALALVHAGAYIGQGYCSLASYPQLFRQQQQRLMHFKPGHRIPGHDSVYTTFEISAQYLVSSEDPVDHEALGLLSVLAFLEGSNIREDMIIKALESGQTPDTPTETSNRPFEGAPWTFRSNDFPCFNGNDIDIAALELYQIPWTWDNNGPNKITVLRQIDPQDIRALSKVATRSPRMPMYHKIHTQILDIETLTSFHLSWKYDPNDDNYIVILREMEHYEVNLVLEHMKRRRERMRFLNPALQTAYEQQSDHASDDLRESIGRDINVSVRNWLAEVGSDTDLDVLRQVPQQFSKALEAKEPLRHLYVASERAESMSTRMDTHRSAGLEMSHVGAAVMARATADSSIANDDIRPSDSMSELSRAPPMQRALLDKVAQEAEDGEVDHLSRWHYTQALSICMLGMDVVSNVRTAAIRLAEMSLISFSRGTISFHPLVHQWARTRQNEIEQREAWERSLCVLALSTEARVGWHSFTPSLRLHLETCYLNWVVRLSDTKISLDIARGLYFLGRQLYRIGSPTSSEVFHTLNARVEFRDGTTSFKSRELLYCEALSLLSLDRPREAKTLLELVLKYRSEFFTPASKEVLVPLVTLAKMHLSDGDHQRVISILEPITWPNANNYESHDADHRDSAYTLALAYLRTNQYKLARPLLEEVVNAEKHMFLPNDSTRLSRMDTLAQVYVALEEEYRAKPLLDEIASIRAQMRDPDPESPYRLMGMHNLVATYVSFGLFESAANVLEDIVRVTTRTLYPSHRTRLENMAQLASVLLKIDSNDRVLELLEEVLKLGATINLQNHRVVADLAKAYIRVGKSDKALKLLKKTLENPVTHSIDDLNYDIWRTLAEAYGASGQYTKAISTSQKILETFRNSKDPSLVEFTKVDLATAFMNSNDMERAIDLLEDTRAKIAQRSSQSMELLSSKLSLAYMRVGLYAKAVPILEHLVHEMHGRKRPVDSELILEECKLAKSYFQIMNTGKAINVLDEGIQTQALAYPFDHRIRFQSINKQIRSRLVLETPTAMFEATVLLEAEIQLEGRFVELDCKTLSGSRLKLLDIYKQTSELEKIHAHLEKVLFQRNKSLGTNAKANFLVNWFAISQNYLDDDKCISMLEEVTQKELESSDENELNCLQHTLVEIYSKISSEKAIPLLEAIVERESSLEGRDRLNCMEQLATAYADSEQYAKVIDASRVLIDALKAFCFEDPQRLRALRSSAAAYLRLDQPTRAAQLLEEVVIIEARLLPEDHWRLLSMRMLAKAYIGLEKIWKLEDAVSLLQKVMQRGRETLHTDPQELAITEAMLSDARDTLAKTLQLQSRDRILASASAVMRWACREITSRAAIMF